jgi:hypothetical protein
MELSRLFVPLLTEQIIGFYDPRTDVLYVVEGAAEEYVGLTIMHELVHALQDQYVDLDSIQRVLGNDDAQAAVQAVIEGQATFVSLFLMAGSRGNIMTTLPTWIDQMRSSIRANQVAQPVFGSAPMVIQETLLFPYMNGADFVGRHRARKIVRSVLDSFPLSTEQILHDSAYFGSRPERPLTVTLPPRGDVLLENTMGEFGTRLFLYKHLRQPYFRAVDTTALLSAANAAAGWGGDRYVTFRTASGDGMAWVTVWDREVDAAEFVNVLNDITTVRHNVQPIRSGTELRYLGVTRTAHVTTREIDGRLAVLYVDVPAGASTAVLDLGRVTVR